MSAIRFKKNIAGFRDVRYRQKTQAMLEAVAQGVADTANQTLKLNGPTDLGYVVGSQPGARRPFGRWRVTVAAVSPHAIRHNAKYNTLVKALNG
jgi:hypothetical protein